MPQPPPTSRRQFLRRSFAFSAAAALAGPFSGCSNGGSNTPTQTAPPSPTPNPPSPTPPTPPPTPTPAPTPQPAHLLLLGDYGEDPAVSVSDQAAVAAGMKSYLQQQNITASAMLMLGDNFYGPLPDVSSSRWQTNFEQMYPQDVFNCPAYVIPGNHDYEGYGAPSFKYAIERAYAAQNKSRWTIPDQYYTVTLPAANPYLTLHALDSNVPGLSATSNAGFPVMTAQRYAQQLAWLEAELAKPLITPFRAIMGHHPLFSDGPHGDNQVLIDDLDPLLRKYKVDLYLNGHDHDLQHLEFTGHPTSFFLSGGGGAAIYPVSTDPSARGPYAVGVYGFSHIQMTSSLLTLHHLDATGKVLHSFTKTTAGAVTIL